MKNYEDQIRDNIIQNIHILGNELEFVGKEYYLPKAQTTKGFIDILAKEIKYLYSTSQLIGMVKL